MVKMKDSGIEWIGEIPETWEKVKFNAIYSNRNTKVSDREYAPLSVTKKGIVPQLATAAKTNDNDNRKLVKSGDFVINSRSDRRGSCGISSLDGSVSLINTVLEPKNSQMEPLYFDFLFHTIQFADEFYKWGHGIVDDLWTTNWNDMKNITLILPTRSEQQLIADFLDHKTVEIDGLIDKINAEIDTLKQYQSSVITQAVTKGLDSNVPMKDSGIEWIGEIPASWKVARGKNILKLLSRKVEPDYEIITAFRDGQVTLRKNRRTEGFTISTKEIGYQGVKANDLVVHAMDGFAGAIGISDADGKASPVLNVLDSNQNKRYVMYYLRVCALLGVFQALAKGIRIRTADTRWDTLKNLNYLLPSKAEQQKIVDYLDQKVSQIQKVIKSKQQQIDQLTGYKNSLIFEYVTGKKQVKEAN
ncbi:restriction endonuclease subunit S [Ligilactobacillus salivarius]|uniref:restriction endonuclease subunit S n=1 Tax=Ligilactobacillus salivarius TaxID=1624 RepID=UPI00339D0937